MPLYRGHLTITVHGPLLTKSSAPGAYGVDSVCARNSSNQFILPWTMVKGRIRDAWRELYRLAGAQFIPDPNSILGPEPENGGGNRSRPDGNFDRYNTRLFGADLVLNPADTPAEGTRTRVSLDPQRHAASDDMLQVMESPFEAGAKCRFEGTIEFHAEEGQADRIKRALVKSLHWTGALGSQTSVGFGRVATVSCKVALVPATAVADPEPESTSMWLRLRADQPLCITETRSQENLFIAGSVIPGAVLKGALAAQWNRLLGSSGTGIKSNSDPARAELAAIFDQIRFCHAKPVTRDASATPVVIPLSLAKVGDDYVDMSGYAPPLPDFPEPPEFQPDWKVWGAVNERFGWPEIESDLRVRTAIDPVARRAKTGNLFAYETVLPDKLEWWCQIVFPEMAADRLAKARGALLDLLADGLHGVGKTKAILSAELATSPPPKVASLAGPQNGNYVLTLQTPALLAPPAAFRGSRASAHLLAAYAEVFADWTGDSLTLVRLFARQTLHGGIYLHRRFQQQGPYRPYVLTATGSVFVFRVEPGRETRAADVIAGWQRTGLPTPRWAAEDFTGNGHDGAHWSNNPYVPENGFGEIAVNLENPFHGGNHA